MKTTPPTVLTDFYKVSHRNMYPPKTETVYSTWIPRGSRMEGVGRVVAFGLQAFVKRYLIDYFEETFFSRDVDEVCDEYDRLICATLGTPSDSNHLRELHSLGYLPLRIKAVKEGTLVPLRVPMFTIENTVPEAFWVTNFLETLLSCECWLPSTSATVALEYRKVLQRALLKTTGSADGVGFLGHDFSMRGMSSVQSAEASGAAHLLSFTGTDTIPAITYLERYYNANVETELVGASIPASEHSVMCAYGADSEFDAFRRLITEVYPEGFVSIVSDTWSLWDVTDKVLPALKADIMARDGRLVVRPDSGDPVQIVAGKLRWDRGDNPNSEDKGVYETLWDIFGGTVNAQGFKVLDPHIGVIYGDAISLERCVAITDRLMAKGFAPTNMVYGIGSWTYQLRTRDTFDFALKTTHVVIDGVERNVFKDPITDPGHMKKSLTGRVVVVAHDGEPSVIDGLSISEQESYASRDLLEDLFVDGRLMRDQTLADIRARIEATL